MKAGFWLQGRYEYAGGCAGSKNDTKRYGLALVHESPAVGAYITATTYYTEEVHVIIFA